MQKTAVLYRLVGYSYSDASSGVAIYLLSMHRCITALTIHIATQPYETAVQQYFQLRINLFFALASPFHNMGYDSTDRANIFEWS